MWTQLWNSSETTPELNSYYSDASNSHRTLMVPEKLLVPTVPPRVLLIDDDSSFTKIMKRVAERQNLEITCCQSLVEFGALRNWDYDVIIMDYDLGAVTGFELTQYLERFTDGEVPVILVSQTKRTDFQQWPTSIREFVHKRLGPMAILDAAFEAHEVARIHSGMVTKKVVN